MSQEVEESVDKVVSNLQHLPIPDPKAFEEDSWAFQDGAAEEEPQPLPISKASDQERMS